MTPVKLIQIENLVLDSPEPEIYVYFDFLGLEYVGDILFYQRVVENLTLLYWRETKTKERKEEKDEKGSKFPGDETQQSIAVSPNSIHTNVQLRSLPVMDQKSGSWCSMDILLFILRVCLALIWQKRVKSFFYLSA